MTRESYSCDKENADPTSREERTQMRPQEFSFCPRARLCRLDWLQCVRSTQTVLHVRTERFVLRSHTKVAGASKGRHLIGTASLEADSSQAGGRIPRFSVTFPGFYFS